MGNKRIIDYKWVEDGLFEVCERYGEFALREIQDSDADEETFLAEVIEEIIQEHTDGIEALMQKSPTKSTKGALKFNSPERDKIPSEFLQAIVPLADAFRDKVISILRKKDITSRMDESDFMISGVKRCIIDMRGRIEDLFKE